MSTYTAVEIREMIDNLDNVIRAGVENGDIKRVFREEKAKVVSKCETISKRS
jgi:hypothetical protein